MKLKPCPFCGEKVRMFIVPACQERGSYNYYKIFCENINCLMAPVTRNYVNKDNAIKAWNKRA